MPPAVKKPTIVDLRGKLAVNANKKWARRNRSDIIGIVIHQSAGSKKWGTKSIAEYHAGPNHISETGCPGICYTYTVEPTGVINLCNDIEDVTWSQGGHGAPIPGTEPNRQYLGICVIGDFDGPSYDGKDDAPTEAQLASLEALVKLLRKDLAISAPNIFGHFQFGKENCPGSKLSLALEKWRSEGLTLPVSIEDWQSMLVKLGYDLGAFGPNHDGVDGDWGGTSKKALAAFQREANIAVSGQRDRFTAVALASAYADVSPKPVAIANNNSN